MADERSTYSSAHSHKPSTPENLLKLPISTAKAHDDEQQHTFGAVSNTSIPQTDTIPKPEIITPHGTLGLISDTGLPDSVRCLSLSNALQLNIPDDLGKEPHIIKYLLQQTRPCTVAYEELQQNVLRLKCDTNLQKPESSLRPNTVLPQRTPSAIPRSRLPSRSMDTSELQQNTLRLKCDTNLQKPASSQSPNTVLLQRTPSAIPRSRLPSRSKDTSELQTHKLDVTPDAAFQQNISNLMMGDLQLKSNAALKLRSEGHFSNNYVHESMGNIMPNSVIPQFTDGVMSPTVQPENVSSLTQNLFQQPMYCSTYQADIEKDISGKSAYCASKDNILFDWDQFNFSEFMPFDTIAEQNLPAEKNLSAVEKNTSDKTTQAACIIQDSPHIALKEHIRGPRLTTYRLDEPLEVAVKQNLPGEGTYPTVEQNTTHKTTQNVRIDHTSTHLPYTALEELTQRKRVCVDVDQNIPSERPRTLLVPAETSQVSSEQPISSEMRRIVLNQYLYGVPHNVAVEQCALHEEMPYSALKENIPKETCFTQKLHLSEE